MFIYLNFNSIFLLASIENAEWEQSTQLYFSGCQNNATADYLER